MVTDTMTKPHNLIASDRVEGTAVRRPNARVASAVKDRVPPSPLLSARSRMRTYLIATTTISAHRMSESTPNTMSRVSGPFSTAAATATRNA